MSMGKCFPVLVVSVLIALGWGQEAGLVLALLGEATLHLALASSLFGPRSPHLQNERVAFYW